jgi:flagellar biosynthesis/type III secretory pathway M-ring protein FliF/YscJ
VEVSEPEYARLPDAAQDSALVERLQKQLGQMDKGKSLSEGEAEDELEPGGLSKKQLATLAEKDPSLITQLIRSWLSEGV